MEFRRRPVFLGVAARTWTRPVTSTPLTPAERRSLLDHYRRAIEPEVRLRAHILLLLADGHPWATVSAVLFCSLSTISRWKTRFTIPEQDLRDIACYVGMLIIGRHLDEKHWPDLLTARRGFYTCPGKIEDEN